MIRTLALLAAVVVPVVVTSSGCDQMTAAHVRAVPLPRAERPPMNLPVSMRQRNWLGNKAEGSCVHASIVSLLRWHHQERLAAWWRGMYGNGEHEYGIERKLTAAGIPYASTHKGEKWFLDECSRTRHGAIIWWKPGHCCTFCGWIRGEDGRIYAVVLDNNYPERLELTEQSQFLRLWNGFGGFALTLNIPPASPIPARAYEVIR